MWRRRGSGCGGGTSSSTGRSTWLTSAILAVATGRKGLVVSEARP